MHSLRTTFGMVVVVCSATSSTTGLLGGIKKKLDQTLHPDQQKSGLLRESFQSRAAPYPAAIGVWDRPAK
jgi:hypothetical protein